MLYLEDKNKFASGKLKTKKSQFEYQKVYQNNRHFILQILYFTYWDNKQIISNSVPQNMILFANVIDLAEMTEKRKCSKTIEQILQNFNKI